MTQSTNAKDLRKVFFITSSYLDFFSVVDGFRDVAIVKFGTYPVTTIDGHSIAIRTLPLHEQKRLARSFLAKHRRGYVLLPSGGTSSFIVRKEKAPLVQEFLKHQGRADKKYHEDLGLLLGYPPCCIKAFINSGPRKSKGVFKSTPFVPCSPTCEKGWVATYEKLRKKYGLEKADFNVWL